MWTVQCEQCSRSKQNKAAIQIFSRESWVSDVSIFSVFFDFDKTRLEVNFFFFFVFTKKTESYSCATEPPIIGVEFNYSFWTS